MKIIIGNSNVPLGKNIVELSQIQQVDTNITSFADGECRIEINKNLNSDETIFIIQSTNQDKFIIELLFIIDALKRLGVKKIIPVIPYFGYSRQDRKVHSGSPISAKVIANMLEVSKVNSLITMDIHFQQFEGFFNIPVYNLSPNKVFIEYIENNELQKDAVVVAPDLGAVKKAKEFANYFNLKTVIINKNRPAVGVSEVTDIIGNVENKNCLIFDDLICGGGTLCNAATKLKELGAESVIGLVTHGVFNKDIKIEETIENSNIDELIITDSISNTINPGKIKIISSAKIFSEKFYKFTNNINI